MKLIAKFFQRPTAALLSGLAAVLAVTLSPVAAFAYRTDTTPVPPGHSDTMGWLLIIFCIALSMTVLCRGSNRSADVRLKNMEEE
jgi:formate/nitrite transporter FocA (FNT family)